MARVRSGPDCALLGQALALALAVIAVAVSLRYAHSQVESLREQTRRFTRSYAELIGIVASDTTTTSTDLDLAISEMIAQYDFPYVETDSTGTPLAWRGIGVEEGTTDAGEVERIARQVEAFDRLYDPIPIRNPGGPLLFHYGDPPEVRRLRVLPYLQLGLMVLVLGLVWWSLRAGLERQRSLVWVGLARESAHQFGTPLSSLQGWLGMLRERMSGGSAVEETGGSAAMDAGREAAPESGSGPGEAESGPGEAEIVEAMAEDVERLVRITNRFAKLGGPTGRDLVDLNTVCLRVVDYMRRRAPRRGAAAVTIETELAPLPPVRGEEELLEWVVENLLKNAMDALGGRRGKITISAHPGSAGGDLRLRVSDDGPGIAPSEQRRIFDPGFSTKRRGWGLGLALSRRLVESHGGRLELLRSRPGQGSVFELTLPATEEDDAGASPPAGEPTGGRPAT